VSAPPRDLQNLRYSSAPCGARLRCAEHRGQAVQNARRPAHNSWTAALLAVEPAERWVQARPPTVV